MENLCLLPEAKPGAGDLGLHRMTSTIYGIAMLVAAIGIPGAMIKYVTEFKDDRTRFNWKGSIHRSLFHLTNKGSIHRSVF